MKNLKFKILIVGLLIYGSSFSQRGKGGAVTVNTANRIVNEYTTLTADALAGATTINVAASTLNANARFTAPLAVGDLIMIIQMQGATILGQPDTWTPTISNPNDPTWGGVTNYNNTGNYEFCQVKSVPNGTSIEIDCGLTYNYTAAGRVQIVRVPRYSTLTISAPGILTCQAWNGTTGGVLAIEVLGNTTINAGGKINTTGTGFRGGALFTTTGRTTTGLYSCVSLDVGANKGESVAGYDTDYTPYGGKFCRAAPANAGGGGNVWNAGGGGGANAGNVAAWNGQGNPDNSVAAYTTAWNLESAGFAASTSSGGGRGGYTFSSSNQDATILGPGTIGVNNAWSGSFRYNLGGLGGRPLDYSTGKIYLGGGGGAGEQDNNRGGAGGSGGGLIYIKSFGNITGSGNDSIISNGNNGGNTNISGLNNGADAAGGAGGGGTIILNAVGTITGIAIKANGGKGGDQLRNAGVGLNEAEGPGGGGGGGYIAVSNAAAVAQQANGGANGITYSTHLSEFPPNGATAGGVGLTNQVITWDTIYARDTVICSNNSVTLSATLFGTIPAGTTIVWYSAAVGGNIIGTGSTYVTPTLTTTTTYYVGFCPGTYTRPVTVTVTPGSDATITQQSSLCVSSPAVTLSAATSGGTWSGNGITNTSTGTFNPATAGVGFHVITYTITTPCAAVDTMTIQVVAAPNATITQVGPYCENDPTVILTAATPGGTWSGTGIINGTTGAFRPSAGGQGNHLITYTITSPCAAQDTVLIQVLAAPNSTITQAGPFCVTNSSVNLTAATGGGTWSGTGITNAATGTFDPATAGVGSHVITYSITGGACPSTDTMTIVVNLVSDATITQVGPYCVSDTSSINLSAVSPGGTWTGTGITNGATGTFNPNTAGVGSHVITYTIGGGCPANDTMTIIVNSSSDATITQAGPYCVSNPTVTLAAATGGGTWSGTGITNGATGDFDPATAGVGSHVITYTIGGQCPSVDTMTIVVNLVSDATITQAGPFCTTDPSLNLSAAMTGGSWTGNGITNASTGNFDPNTAGVGSHVITYTITGACPANDTMTIIINQGVNPTITQQSQLCIFDPSVTLTAATGGGVWSGTGITNGANGTFDPATAGAGTHVITYTISGPCPGVDTMTILVTPTITVTINAVPTLCVNSPSVNLTGSISNGVWSGTGITNANTGTFDPSVSGAGTFTISYGVSGPCGDTATQSITVNPLPTPTVSSNITSGCGPLCVTFNESSGANCSSVLYDFGDGNNSTSTSPTNCYTQSGSYSVSITCTDANGCSATSTVTNMITVHPDPIATINPGIISIYDGGSVTLNASGGSSYNWYSGTGLSCTNCANPVVSPSQTTTYCVEVTSSNGCVDSTCVTVTVEEVPCMGDDNLGVPNAFSPNNDGVNNEFCLQGWDRCSESFLILIYDRWGEKVFESKDPLFCWDGKKDGRIMDAGVFVYYIEAVMKQNYILRKKGNISLIR